MASATHAGDYPEVGDLFKFAKGKKNIMGDVMDAKVCVKPRSMRSDLHP
jgi:hypothetical protein